MLNNFGSTGAIICKDPSRDYYGIDISMGVVARKALHAIVYGPNVPITIHRHYALTFTLFVLTLTVGMVTTDLRFVLEFTGAISASLSVTLCLPCYI